MRIVAPDYYARFACTAGACRHTCCKGWEVDIDGESLTRFLASPDIVPFVEMEGTPHIRLTADEACPFLNEDGLCRMILTHGEGMLCGICRDHPRFRNYFSGLTEVGLGLVCEEACRLVLSQNTPMRLVTVADDGADVPPLPADERYLLEVRASMLASVRGTGPLARLREYLIYRHLPNALYDGRLEARAAFVDRAMEEITAGWDGAFETLCERVRVFSYDVEYDEEVFEARLAALEAGTGACSE